MCQAEVDWGFGVKVKVSSGFRDVGEGLVDVTGLKGQIFDNRFFVESFFKLDDEGVDADGG